MDLALVKQRLDLYERLMRLDKPIGILLLAALIAIPFVAPPFTVILWTSILMYVVLTVSWTIFSGSTGYVSLAKAA
jgi:ABC-type branched-subunit amino acid transport system permease subunit